MSKTYNTKHDFHKIADEYDDPYIRATRHPNKRKNKSLEREFSDVGLTNPVNWKYHRFGDAHDRSSRTHLVRRELAAKRRNRLKNQTREIINEQINEG